MALSDLAVYLKLTPEFGGTRFGPFEGLEVRLGSNPDRCHIVTATTGPRAGGRRGRGRRTTRPRTECAPKPFAPKFHPTCSGNYKC